VGIGVTVTGSLLYSNLSTGWSTLTSTTQRINFMIPIFYLRIGLVTVIAMKYKVNVLEKESYCLCSCYPC